MPAAASGRVLSVQSHVVSGYVGNKNAVFALNRLGFEVDALNTTQLSNHTGFPEVTGQRLGGADVRALWDGMKANGLTNQTHVLSGYIGDPSIVEELAAIVRELPGREYVADPVFGDEGKLYVSSAIPRRFEELLLPLATVITPNQFEAEVLTGVKIATLEDAARACRVLFDKGCGLKTVVITSCGLGEREHKGHVTLVASVREFPKRVLVSRVAKVDGYFTGTGDLLAALLLGNLTKHGDVAAAVDHAVAGLQHVLRDTHAHANKGQGPSEESPPASSPAWWSRRELRLVQNQDFLVALPASMLSEVASTWHDVE